AAFEVFLDSAVRDYAQDKITAGTWSEEQALELSTQEFQALLPNGVDTPDHYLFTIVARDTITTETQTAVGMLWFAIKDFGAGQIAFLYNFEIAEPFRRRGYGTQALQALEHEVAQLGLTKIALHVFGYNQGAFALYQKMGYAITDISMAKTITSQP
ncbi:MAG: GNAT family N-acetyltransferase, partial [Abitibacteriaceae bacterium]|nr:GNAT family N-acetyltransferase [Abditibacteriaceae bacterium]